MPVNSIIDTPRKVRFTAVKVFIWLDGKLYHRSDPTIALNSTDNWLHHNEMNRLQQQDIAVLGSEDTTEGLKQDNNRIHFLLKCVY